MNMREIAISPALMREFRASVRKDAEMMEALDLPLSAQWLRQMDKMDKARMMEAQLLALEQAPALVPQPGQQARRVRAPRLARYEIDEILEEKLTRRSRWFLVKWAGYHPSWEAWRVHGEVGTALETWEPLKGLLGTEALASWEQS